VLVFVLNAAAEMFRRLKQERTHMLHETEQLQEQIRLLEAAIRLVSEALNDQCQRSFVLFIKSFNGSVNF